MYGQLYIAGRASRAHRVAYRIVNGDIPVGMYICHKCDNKLCVNPKHLYAGTHADNTRDAVERGRFISGRRHWTKSLIGIGQGERARKALAGEVSGE